LSPTDAERKWIALKRVRITIHHDPDHPSEDLRRAVRVRRDLWAHSSVEIDPDGRDHGTHRDEHGNAYFQFVTDRLDEVERVLNEYGHADYAKFQFMEDLGSGAECVSCGNISPENVTQCPNCGFRDIDPCPYCNHEIGRLVYLPKGGDLFKCPNCHHRVRLSFTDPLFDANGHYSQPLVRVVPAEVPASDAV
jgi:DNA-directed RNA polymerase subunit RPC12/RpoP